MAQLWVPEITGQSLRNPHWVLEAEWKPYLNGNREFETAIGAQVNRLTVDP